MEETARGSLMSELTPEQEEQMDKTLERAMAEPMPPELRGQIEDLIEPHTMNMYLKHRDVMDCIRVAFPVIRQYLREHHGD